MICPVVTYAPIAATKPIIAVQPLNLSASCVKIGFVFVWCVMCLLIGWICVFFLNALPEVTLAV